MTRMAGSAMASLFGDMGSPDFSQIGAQGLQSTARQQMSSENAIARDLMAKDNAERIVEEAKLQAAGIRSGAAAQQQQQMGSLLNKGLTGLGGLIPSGGGGSPGGKDYGMSYSNLFKGI